MFIVVKFPCVFYPQQKNVLHLFSKNTFIEILFSVIDQNNREQLEETDESMLESEASNV
jgi:hypothetical protein